MYQSFICFLIRSLDLTLFSVKLNLTKPCSKCDIWKLNCQVPAEFPRKRHNIPSDTISISAYPSSSQPPPPPFITVFILYSFSLQPKNKIISNTYFSFIPPRKINKINSNNIQIITFSSWRTIRPMGRLDYVDTSNLGRTSTDQKST